MKSKWSLELLFFCPPQWKTHLSANFQASMNESTLIGLVFVFGNRSLGQNPKQVQPNKSNMFIHCEDQTKDIFTSYNITLSLYKSFLPFLFFQLYSGTTGYNFLLGVLRYKFITLLQYCTRQNYNTVQINAITAGAEVALIPLTLSLFEMQCRDQIKRPAYSGSLKGQTGWN